VVEEIVEDSGTPYFCFKDIDENKPTGSIRIRVETIGYFLKRYREDLVREKEKKQEIERRLREFEQRLRQELPPIPSGLAAPLAPEETDEDQDFIPAAHPEPPEAVIHAAGPDDAGND
jgi:hypothetical protein